MYGQGYSSNIMLSTHLAPQGRVPLPVQSGLDGAGGFEVLVSYCEASMHKTADPTTIYDYIPPLVENSTILIGHLTQYSVECFGKNYLVFHCKNIGRMTLTDVTCISCLDSICFRGMPCKRRRPLHLIWVVYTFWRGVWFFGVMWPGHI